MGLKTMIYVWSTPYSGSKKLMLMAIADNAEEDTGIAFPGVETLATKCGIKARAAQALITELEKVGEIVVFVGKGTKSAHGWTNLYYMKKYRETLGLKTPNASSRVEQITPKEMHKPAPLDKGMHKPASEGMHKPASEGMQNLASHGMQNPASKHSVKPAVKLKEKESLDVETLFDEIPPVSPIGDLRSGDDPAIRGAALLEDAFAVEADDSGSQLADSQSAEKTLLPVPAPRRAAKPEPKPKKPAPAAQRPVVKPDKPAKTPRALDPLQEAVGYGFGEAPGGKAGKIGAFLAGSLKGDKNTTDLWVRWQPELHPTPELIPQLICAFALWYSQHKRYKRTYKEQESLPVTTQLLRERWDEFMTSMKTNPQMEPYWMPRSKAILDRLMQGEKLRPEIAVSTAPGANTTGRVESAAAYLSVTPSKDAAYADRREEGTAELAAEILGAL